MTRPTPPGRTRLRTAAVRCCTRRPHAGSSGIGPLRPEEDPLPSRLPARLLAAGKTVYDTIALQLLPPILLFAGIGWLLAGVLQPVAAFTGDDLHTLLWQRIALLLDTSTTTVRIGVFLPLQLALLYVLWRPLRWLVDMGRRLAGPLATLGRFRPLRWVGEGLLTVGVTAVLVPFVLQPTLVPLRLDRTTWADRAANLLDGTATVHATDSVVGLYRRWQALPVPGLHSIAVEDLERRGLDAPMMARWDPILEEVTRDRDHFAQTKAFLWVESAGRQYAVSTTGCAGLMQFCVSTAQRRPFRQIFGAGSVYACDCGGRPCSVPKSLRDALETDSLALSKHPDGFPCDASDARFDGRKALTAGAAYTTELAEDVGGNLYLMYIGYNSGPAVAKRLWKRIGKNPDATLDDLRPHLAPVLERWYGKRAVPRANGLLDVHLPKLKRAYDHFRSQAR